MNPRASWRWCLAWMMALGMDAGAADVRTVPSAPEAIAYAPDGQMVAVTDTLARRVVFIAAATGAVVGTVPVTGIPAGIAWSQQGVLVADRSSREVVGIDAAAMAIRRRIPAGRRPTGLAVTPDGRRLVVCDSAEDQALILDLASGARVAGIPTGYQPEAVAIAPDGRTAVVVALLPTPTDAGGEAPAVQATIIDLVRGAGTQIRLPPGSSCARGVAISPDGGTAVITHTVGRTNMPTTHLDAGWVLTNAMTVIDLPVRERLATVLLDRLGDGAADPWGIVFGERGAALWVALAGVHELARIDATRLLDLLQGRTTARDAEALPAIWRRIRADPRVRDELTQDLTALAGAGLITRHPLPGRGPRGMALAPDGVTVAIALHFSAAILQRPATGSWQRVVLGEDAEHDAARQGGRLYHDASSTYQRWLSCASCHPGGRADGLNWDLLNDGVGNPKNTRSHVLADQRAPCMSLGVRADHRIAIQAGFRHIAFREPAAGEVAVISRYLATLHPEPSPWLQPDGSPSAAAERGRLLFTGAAGCTACHAGPWRSDQQLHRVGTTPAGVDQGKPILTPMLVELWRTAPYLHDGSAATLRAVFRVREGRQEHGSVDQLQPAEWDDLIAYLMSL